MLDPLFALSPLDGRYRSSVETLSSYFSEYALQKYRVQVEIEWLIFLCNTVKLPRTHVFTKQELVFLRDVYNGFDAVSGNRVKEIEKTTNHDVKAVEYFIKETLKESSMSGMLEWVHFACTSEDINNLSYALMVRDFMSKEYMPMISSVTMQLLEMARRYKKVAMLARTHGQTASPTTVGKECINVVARLDEQLIQVAFRTDYRIFGKINGAVGNFNAHVSAFPDLDWPKFGKQFVESLGLVWNPYTTQIEPHDFLAELFDCVMRVNTILIDLDRDIWTYISLGYFKQKVIAGQVGSSTMPHKVNPIDFENSEGNLGLANAMFSHFSQKLPLSRMQRDLTDSTVLRNVGVAFGYSMLAYRSLNKGLSKLELNAEKLADDLNASWEVLAEPIQTVLRAYGVEGAYEKLKAVTRGKVVTQKQIHAFLDGCKELPAKERTRLKKLTPATYTGFAEELVDRYTSLRFLEIGKK